MIYLEFDSTIYNQYFVESADLISIFNRALEFGLESRQPWGGRGFQPRPQRPCPTSAPQLQCHYCTDCFRLRARRRLCHFNTRDMPLNCSDNQVRLRQFQILHALVQLFQAWTLCKPPSSNFYFQNIYLGRVAPTAPVCRSNRFRLGWHYLKILGRNLGTE